MGRSARDGARLEGSVLEFAGSAVPLRSDLPQRTSSFWVQLKSPLAVMMSHFLQVPLWGDQWAGRMRVRLLST